ncbi:MAG: glycosyltransferase family 4 protein [Elusimicrobia bacterium]|nr:glycosyltransferase family 4 protein [Elusimicrobiota bacterium]
MRIIHLHDEPWDSGIAQYALTLAGELGRRGHEIQFWAACGSHASRQAKRAGLETREMAGLGSILSLRRELLRRRADLLNPHTGSTQVLALAASAGLDVPIVRTRADARPPRGGWPASLLASRTRGFIAPNTRLEQALRRLFPGRSVALIPQGIDAPKDPPPLPVEPRIGILGRLDPVKGHELLLEAAVALRDSQPRARFSAAGPPGARRDSLERFRDEVRSLRLEDRFEFLGFVPDRWSFIERCRIGVVASTGSEAVSRAGLEWMAMGRPLVAAKVGCLPDLVEHEETGLLFDPGDTRGLEEALSRLIQDTSLADRLGAAGRRRFESRYSLERFVQSTEAFYERLRNNPH